MVGSAELTLTDKVDQVIADLKTVRALASDQVLDSGSMRVDLELSIQVFKKISERKATLDQLALNALVAIAIEALDRTLETIARWYVADAAAGECAPLLQKETLQ